MYNFAFRNKWVLLATMILLLAGISALVGREGHEGILSRTQNDAATESRRQAAQDGTADIVHPSLTEDEPQSTADDDTDQSADDDGGLIDNADGYDPSPADDQSDEGASAGSGQSSDARAENDSGTASGSTDEPGE